MAADATPEEPRFHAPMLARPVEAPPPGLGPLWACEVKWDGLRVIATVDGAASAAFARGGRPLASTIPARLAAALPGRRAVLDGELVVAGPDGRPSFTAALSLRRELAADDDGALLVVFDLLHLDGRSTRALPYDARRALLAGLLPAGPCWAVPAPLEGDADDLVATTRAAGLEGLVFKRRDSPYVPGRRPGTWLKLRHVSRGTFAIAGWAPGEDGRRERAGSLVLAADDGAGGLAYCGKVGSGLTEELRLALPRALAPHVRPSPAIADVPGREARGWVWTEPLLRCAVEYLTWSDHKPVLRSPVFLRILGPGEESPLSRRKPGSL